MSERELQSTDRHLLHPPLQYVAGAMEACSLARMPLGGPRQEIGDHLQASDRTFFRMKLCANHCVSAHDCRNRLPIIYAGDALRGCIKLHVIGMHKISMASIGHVAQKRVRLIEA